MPPTDRQPNLEPAGEPVGIPPNRRGAERQPFPPSQQLTQWPTSSNQARRPLASISYTQGRRQSRRAPAIAGHAGSEHVTSVRVGSRYWFEWYGWPSILVLNSVAGHR